MLNNISIIIPNYNSSDGLKNCLDSIYKQIDKNDRIIIVDDCSTDDSLLLIEEYLKHSNIILIKHNSNMGVSTSRNDGLKEVNTKLVTFIDSDDTIEEQYIEFIKNNFNNNIKCMTFGFNYIENTSGIKWIKNCNCIEDSFEKKLLSLEKSGLIESCCNKIYLSSIIKKNRIEFNRIARIMEDYEFNLSYFKYIDDIKVYNIAFYNYIYNGDISASSKYKDNLLKRYYEIRNLRLEFYKKIRLDEEVVEFNASFLITCLNNLYKRDCSLTKTQRRVVLKEIINTPDFGFIRKKRNKNSLEKMICLLSFPKNILLVDINFRFAHFIKNNSKSIRKIFRNKNKEEL